MNESDFWLSLSREVSVLHRETSWFQLGSFVVALSLASWLGQRVRVAVSWLWKLNLDRERKLATLGTIVQLSLAGLSLLGLLAHGLRTAPGVTLLIALVVLPTSGVLLRGPWQNFLAGLTLLLQRPIREGDDILLSDGRTGKVSRIRLTATFVSDGADELILPNALLLANPLRKLPEQPGIVLKMRLPAPHPPRIEELEQARKVLLFSPFRAAGSEVSVKELLPGPGLELSLRVISESAKAPAKRELGQKVMQGLGWSEPKDRPALSSH